MDAVLYADDDEDDDADFRFTVMVKEAEIVAELAGRIFGASHPLAKDAQKVLGRGHLQGTYQAPLACLSNRRLLRVRVATSPGSLHIRPPTTAPQVISSGTQDRRLRCSSISE